MLFLRGGKSEMEKEKKPEFVVTDRRKFNVDGEPRPGAPVDPKPEAATPSSTPSSAPAATPAANTAASQSAAPPAKPVAAKPEPTSLGVKKPADNVATERFVPEPITETGYNGDNERTEFGGQKMEFIHLLDMLVQTAMMYGGAMEGGTERRVDIVGMRQMIDLISVLESKTKGNLSEQEQ